MILAQEGDERKNSLYQSQAPLPGGVVAIPWKNRQCRRRVECRSKPASKAREESDWSQGAKDLATDEVASVVGRASCIEN